jgi:hypothetical protein
MFIFKVYIEQVHLLIGLHALFLIGTEHAVLVGSDLKELHNDINFLNQ